MRYWAVDGAWVHQAFPLVECDPIAKAYIADEQLIAVWQETPELWHLVYEQLECLNGDVISGKGTFASADSAFAEVEAIMQLGNEGQRVGIDEIARLMFDAWNASEFGGTLAPIAVIIADGTQLEVEDALGSYVDDAAELGLEEAILIHMGAVREIAEYRDEDTFTVMADTLLHEMTHYWNTSCGVNDTNEDGTHTEAFRDAAIQHGLECTQGTQGWNNTSVRPDTWKRFKSCSSDTLLRLMNM